MASISNNQIARAIYSVLADKTERERSLLYKEIVRFLKKKRLLSKSPQILEKLAEIINQEEGKIEAKVYSARPLTEQTKKDITERLGQRYEGKQVILREKIKEKLIGGFRVEIGDEVIDLSLKNKIKKLQEHLTKQI